MNRVAEYLNIADLVTRVISYVPTVFAALVILVLFWLLYRVTRVPLQVGLEKAGLHPALVRSLVESIYRVALAVVALVTAAGQLGINVGAALAGIGVAGIAIGFAAQDSLANIIAGFTIFLDKPFEVGDWVTVAGKTGEVSGITMRSTRIRTRQNTWVVIPNKTIIDEVLVNHSNHGETRIDVPVGIAYKEFIPQAREVLLRAMEGLPGIRRDPPPAVVVTELGSSSVNLEVRVWTDTASEEDPIISRVLEASKLALDAAGIQIPFPHLQLFVDNVEDRVWRKLGAAAAARAGSEAAPQ